MEVSIDEDDREEQLAFTENFLSTRGFFYTLYPDGKWSDSYDHHSHFPDEETRDGEAHAFAWSRWLKWAEPSFEPTF